MKTIGIIANSGKPRAGDVLRRIAGIAGPLGIELVLDETTAGLLRGADVRVAPSAQVLASVDAVMALGGDGTMLRVVRELDGRDTPVMGVNIGGLGFLTSVAEEELDQALRCLADDRFEVSVRSVIDGAVRREGRETARYRALNEIVVTGGPLARLATLDVTIDGQRVASYRCDGLIVATPTGSTGHSLSAGGPILLPDVGAFVLSLVCPHTLSSRPLVAPDRSEIVVVVAQSDGDVRLSVDGQVGQTLDQGDGVWVRRSDRHVRFLHLPGHRYFGVLRQKLHWGGHHA